MEDRCGALAAYLVETHGVGPGTIIPIFFSRSIEMLIAIFSVVSAISAVYLGGFFFCSEGEDVRVVDEGHAVSLTSIVSAVESRR